MASAPPAPKKGFLDAIMALLGGSQAPPPDPNEGINVDRPWDSPVLTRGAQGPTPAPSPTPTPMAATSPADDAFAQAQRLARQRELMAKILPEGTWNTPQ